MAAGQQGDTWKTLTDRAVCATGSNWAHTGKRLDMYFLCFTVYSVIAGYMLNNKLCVVLVSVIILSGWFS